jgi:hypothetical protein
VGYLYLQFFTVLYGKGWESTPLNPLKTEH